MKGEVRDTVDKRAKIVGRCVVCGYQMTKDELWLSDDLSERRVYCYSHAPNNAIRLKDTIRRRDDGRKSTL